MPRRLRRMQHGFHRAAFRLSNIILRCQQPSIFTRTARIHELNGQLKEELARMPNTQLYTPRDENLSAGMVCFDVKGMKPEQVVKRLLDQRIVASTTPYRLSYARLACSVINTPQEVDVVIRAIRDLG